jgi:putative hydrolases of HD superfamily
VQHRHAAGSSTSKSPASWPLPRQARPAAQWADGFSAEARLARDADVLEAVLHVRESLPDQPALRDRWVSYLAGSVQTSTGRRVLAAILATGPDEWWTRLVTGG